MIHLSRYSDMAAVWMNGEKGCSSIGRNLVFFVPKNFRIGFRADTATILIYTGVEGSDYPRCKAVGT